MDQASSLRDLMTKTQQVGFNPVAILSTSDIRNYSNASKIFAMELSNQIKKKVALLGICNSKEENQLEERLEGKIRNFSPTFLNDKTIMIPSELSILSKIRNNEKKCNDIVYLSEEVESLVDTVVYFTGNELNSATINLTLIANKLIVLMKPTTKSITELTNYIKIFKSLKSKIQVGVIMDTNDAEFFQEQMNKIQELYLTQFNYYIEPIGFFNMKSTNELEMVNDFKNIELNITNILHKEEKKSFSESIKRLLL